MSRARDPSPRLSVVICTHDRAHLLPGVIGCLAAQSLAPDGFEVLVIENACRDDTAEVVSELTVQHPELRLRRVREAQLGLSYARITGLREARAERVVFTDDDCLPEPGWLQALERSFEAWTPEPACVLGACLPDFEGERPDWFQSSWVEIDNGPRAFLVPSGSRRGLKLSGSNMAWRRSALEAVGSFGQLGMRGRSLGLGEETLAIDRLLLRPELGPVAWAPEAVVRDQCPRDQQRIVYRLRRCLAVGISEVDICLAGGTEGEIQGWRQRVQRLQISLRALARRVWSCLGKLGRLRREPQRFLVEDFGAVVDWLGRVLALVGVRPRIRQR